MQNKVTTHADCEFSQSPALPEGLRNILTLAVQLKREHFRKAAEFVEEVSANWQKVKMAELERNRRENHHYSPLHSITIKETDHSRILGELLDPKGSHGQGAFFLHSFLDLLGVFQPQTGEWKVTIETGRVDILLRRLDPPSVIIIENKVNAAVDQEGQLYRYWLQEIYHPFPNLDYQASETRQRFKIVYAPHAGFLRPSATSLQRPATMLTVAPNFETVPLPIDTFSFRLHLAPWLEKLSLSVSSQRLRVFLKLYTEIWKISHESSFDS